MISVPAFAQGVIYKCTDANGEISYSTDSTSGKCEKTNLAKIDKSNILNKPGYVVNANNQNAGGENVNITVNSSDQIVRDQKRATILQGELTQERTQLKTVLEMLSKADKNDASQIGQLKKMEEAHKRNITSLEKELGIKSDINLAAKPIPGNLPFALPKESQDVELVEAPKPPQAKEYAPKSPYTIIDPAKIAKPSVATENVQPNVANVGVASAVNKPVSVKPVTPYVLINPSATTKTIPSEPVAAVASTAPVQPVKHEIIKEYRQPAAITNKSIKNKINLQNQ